MPFKVTTIILTLLLCLCLPASGALAQDASAPDSDDGKAHFHSEMERFRARSESARTAPAADQNYDVTWYKLDLTITTDPKFVTGVVTIRSTAVIDGLSSVRIDLNDSLVIDAVYDGNTLLAYSRESNVVTVQLDSPLLAGDLFDIQVTYHGLPPWTNFGSGGLSIGFTRQGAPWIWSLSQPYGAKDWWPCKDQLLDKADSADVLITCADSLLVGSNGSLAGVVDNGDGTATTHWKERYPIDTYLISIAVSNYVPLSYWFHYGPGDSMEVLNYVLPVNLALAQAVLPSTVTMLEIFSEMLGLYPFIDEKYGHCEFGWGGAMEHQTMTSTGIYQENTLAHELAHQWFGDMITCGSWADLWLNEGFATHLTGLYRERAYGGLSYYNYMTVPLHAAKSAVGTLSVQDTLSVGNLFQASRVYYKGASVLHMLRGVLGDSVFFRVLYEYANDSTFRFGTATTADFRAVCESVSGIDLGYFFDQWVYGESYPRYSYGWRTSPDTAGFITSLRVTQSTMTSNPVAFRMPVDVRIRGAGLDTTFVITNELTEQDYQFTTAVAPTSVRFDPDRWILRDLDSVSYALLAVDDAPGLPSGPFLLQNYPNPFNPSTTIAYGVAVRSAVTLKIFDILGAETAGIVSGMKDPGRFEAVWDASGMPAGVYLAEFVAEPVDRSAPASKLVTKLLYIR